MKGIQQQPHRGWNPTHPRLAARHSFDGAIRRKGKRLLDPVWVIRVRGEIDLATTPDLTDALRTAWHDGEGTVVLDLCKSTFLDSSGLHALLSARRRLTRAKRRLVIACPEGPIRSVMDVTRLSGMFDIQPTLEAALAAEPRRLS